MKKYIFLLLVIPAIGFAQVKKTPVKAKKTVVAKKVVKTPLITKLTKPADGFLIDGTVGGYPDGTPVTLLNGNNGAPEGNAVVTKGKFSFTGQSMFPDFKVLTFTGGAPFITLFLDNSLVTVNAKKDQLESAVIKGSASHDDFTKFMGIYKPYEKLFMGEPVTDTLVKKNAEQAFAKFIQDNKESYITPLAVYRHYQLTESDSLLEADFNSLGVMPKNSPIGGIIAKQIADSKKNPIGKPLADFSQADTSGNQIRLSSFKGKYVLVDFWASWCRPCRMENPNVVNVYTKFKDKNFTVLGVSLDQAKPAWLDAIKMDGLTWTHVSDLKGWGNEVAHQFEIVSIPQNFLLDPQGNVIAKNLRGPALESKLASLIK
ncbi:TlpA disulfide reductase family protein [Ferruginibacter sp. HRS2-29]|uniref:TlpA disulfide reductase family protein n=1 Tax=Ferruginibacter sp. HRS2-29 TaxID=2487334 RepID=UPI0020CE4A27|nr:TlpA disulfide reductase family protein [Ferruginibacter sp. HRS2-29]